MLFHRLSLQNFRQFRNETLDFAQGGETNATVVHGQNGSGKTTLLNAFTWALYDDVSFTLRPDALASQGAVAEIDSGETVHVEAVLEFEHEETEYKLTRWVEYQKQSADDYTGEPVDEGLSLEYHEEDGGRGSRNNPQRAIEQMLPKRLSDLFFFDGEYITHLSETRGQGEIRSAIRNVMGLTILERSITHLKEVESRFEDELKKYADTELQDLLSRSQALNAEIDDLEQSINAKENSRDKLAEEIQNITLKLEGMEETRELEEERTRLEEELNKTEQEIIGINTEIETAISKHAYLVFAMPSIEETAKDLDELRERGEIPSELSNSFVERLLDQGKCICGRPLEEETEAYQHIESHRSDVNTDGFDQAAIRIISHLEEIKTERAEYFSEVESLLNKRSGLRDKVDDLAERIDEIEGELEEFTTVDPKTGETPQELQQARKQKEEEREEYISEIAKLEERLAQKRETLKEIEAEIAQARQEQSEAELARRRRQAAAAVRKQLESSFEELQHRVRDWSDTLVKETFAEVASKDYDAEITDDFELRIRDRIEDKYLEVEKSRGERQIASLTFIASLTQIARERYLSSSDSQYFSGGIYPIVMDSPFGALDDEHRRQVSRVVPRMAEQVIVMVTDSQWRGPVANELSDIAKKQYRLDYDPGDEPGEYPRTRIIADQPEAQSEP
jgi:DNA sulfur modification protein DndD